MDRIKVAVILQKYVIWNVSFLLYGIAMFFVVRDHIPPEYKMFIHGMMISNALRTVCTCIVQKHLVLVANSYGIRLVYDNFLIPQRVDNQPAVQRPQSNQEEQV